MSHYLSFGAFLYGLSGCLVLMTDLGLVLELIPDNCGTAAALAIQSPSESIGFVIGSVLISMSLWAFPIPERDKGRSR